MLHTHAATHSRLVPAFSNVTDKAYSVDWYSASSDSQLYLYTDSQQENTYSVTSE